MCFKVMFTQTDVYINYLALLACFLFFVILAIIWIALEMAYDRGLFNRFLNRLKSCSNKWINNQDSTSSREDGHLVAEKTANAENKQKKSSRLKSLDTFRGYN